MSFWDKGNYNLERYISKEHITFYQWDYYLKLPAVKPLLTNSPWSLYLNEPAVRALHADSHYVNEGLQAVLKDAVKQDQTKTAKALGFRPIRIRGLDEGKIVGEEGDHLQFVDFLLRGSSHPDDMRPPWTGTKEEFVKEFNAAPHHRKYLSMDAIYVWFSINLEKFYEYRLEFLQDVLPLLLRRELDKYFAPRKEWYRQEG
jgi:hypothetical protein